MACMLGCILGVMWVFIDNDASLMSSFTNSTSSFSYPAVDLDNKTGRKSNCFRPRYCRDVWIFSLDVLFIVNTEEKWVVWRLSSCDCQVLTRCALLVERLWGVLRYLMAKCSHIIIRAEEFVPLKGLTAVLRIVCCRLATQMCSCFFVSCRLVSSATSAFVLPCCRM